MPLETNRSHRRDLAAALVAALGLLAASFVASRSQSVAA